MVEVAKIKVMFKSLRLHSYGEATGEHIYIIEDSEFGEVKVKLGVGEPNVIVREYSRRNLPVGKNLALFVLWSNRTYGMDITSIIHYQDDFCAKYFPEWKKYAFERDKALAKMMLLK